MTLQPIGTVVAKLCDLTGLDCDGIIELHADGIILVHPEIGSIGLPWNTLSELLDDARVQGKLEELNEE